MDRLLYKQLTSFLGRAFLVSVGFQLFALVMLVGLKDWAYSVHSSLFGLSPEQFALSTYLSLGIMKMLSLVLFLVPWVALKWMATEDDHRAMLAHANQPHEG